MKTKLSGNEAVAFAMKQINPDVVSAFPITPSTEIPEYYSRYVANGEVDTEFIAVESEHSAMAASIGAGSAGARAMTATSSNGLAYMWEMIYIASSMRVPVIMSVVNRSISGPLNIHNDHSDIMGMRDAGWLILFSEDNQEAYDNTIIGTKLAETEGVELPIAVCQDGFITSHSIENMETLGTELVKDFVGKYKRQYSLLDRENTMTIGTLDLPDHLFEHKRQQAEGMANAKNAIKKIDEEYLKLSGRKYGYYEKYYLDDADYVVVLVGSTAGTAKVTVDELRKKGKKVGLLKIRMYRPFPGEEIAEELKKAKAIAILDKASSLNNQGGPIYTDVAAVMYKEKYITDMVSYIYGIGGRDVTKDHIEKVFIDLEQIQKDKKNDKVVNPYRYLGLKEE